MNSDLIEFVDMSYKIGCDPMFVQGAGGNTSFKLEDILWVKASGFNLSDALKQDIFVPVRYKEVIYNFASIDDTNLSDFVFSERGYRPSIETLFHAILPQKVVIHTHSISSITISICQNSISTFASLLHGFNWHYIPYTKPGKQLAEVIHGMSDYFTHSDEIIYILENHGLIIAAQNCKAAEKLLFDIEMCLQLPILRQNVIPDFILLNSLIKNQPYRLPKFDIVHLLALDMEVLSLVTSGTLFPDQIVFLYNKILVTNFENIEDCLILRPSVLVVKNLGVLIQSECSIVTDELLNALALISCRVFSEKIKYLTPRAEAEILDWEAEHYRKKIQNSI